MEANSSAKPLLGPVAENHHVRGAVLAMLHAHTRRVVAGIRDDLAVNGRVEPPRHGAVERTTLPQVHDLRDRRGRHALRGGAVARTRAVWSFVRHLPRGGDEFRLLLGGAGEARIGRDWPARARTRFAGARDTARAQVVEVREELGLDRIALPDGRVRRLGWRLGRQGGGLRWGRRCSRWGKLRRRNRRWRRHGWGLRCHRGKLRRGDRRGRGHRCGRCRFGSREGGLWRREYGPRRVGQFRTRRDAQAPRCQRGESKQEDAPDDHDFMLRRSIPTRLARDRAFLERRGRTLYPSAVADRGSRPPRLASRWTVEAAAQRTTEAGGPSGYDGLSQGVEPPVPPGFIVSSIVEETFAWSGKSRRTAKESESPISLGRCRHVGSRLP